jgi:hypothetical protein
LSATNALIFSENRVSKMLADVMKPHQANILIPQAEKIQQIFT